jgi:pyruvate carboxylase subunit B
VKYVVHIMSEDVELDISHGSVGTTVTLGDTTLSADLVRIGSSSVYSLTLDGRSYEFSAHKRNGVHEIVLDGEPYSAGVMDERAMMIAAASGPTGDDEGGETVAAPMPGVVIGIAVEVGAQVEPGQGILTLEAMKMENELKSERGGVVKAIHVAVGRGVAQGEVLIELE